MSKFKKVFAIKTKYGVFQCIFEPEKDMGGFMVEARGTQGAISWGKSLIEARHMIVEAIEGVVEANIIADAEKRGIIKVNSCKKLVSVA